MVIPAWNEAGLIEDAVRGARNIGEEVIVVDAGSPDRTATLAADAGAKVVLTAKSRGLQLDAGARAAGGDVLLFLHADARLPSAARDAILGALADPRAIGGNFRLVFLPESRFTRFLAVSNDLRRMLTRRYYGDSGIFARRTAYFALGGFPPLPLMEDYAFSRSMERAGRTAYIRHPAIYASDRRFHGRELAVLWLWMRLQTAHWLGAGPDTLARAYPDVREADSGAFIDAWRKAAPPPGCRLRG